VNSLTALPYDRGALASGPSGKPASPGPLGVGAGVGVALESGPGAGVEAGGLSASRQ
jgi:hypothetical protein